MIRKIVLALAVSLCTLGVAAAQNVDPLESWDAQTPRSGPWARDIARMNAAYELGDFETLAVLIERLKPKFAESYGVSSPAYAEAVMYEALLYWESGYLREATPLFREAARHYEAALGEHRDVALAFTSYADALVEAFANARLLEAEDYYRRSLNIRRAVLPTDAVEQVSSRVDLARVILRRHKLTPSNAALAEARELTAEAVALATPAHDQDFAPANIMLAETLTQLGLQEEAEAVLRSALNRLSLAPSRQRWASSGDIEEALIENLSARGQTAQADLVRATRFSETGSDL